MESSARTVYTLSLPVSSEMAPTFKVLVYHVTEDGEVLSDAITLPVNGIGGENVSLFLCSFVICLSYRRQRGFT